MSFLCAARSKLRGWLGPLLAWLDGGEIAVPGYYGAALPPFAWGYKVRYKFRGGNAHQRRLMRREQARIAFTCAQYSAVPIKLAAWSALR